MGAKHTASATTIAPTARGQMPALQRVLSVRSCGWLAGIVVMGAVLSCRPGDSGQPPAGESPPSSEAAPTPPSFVIPQPDISTFEPVVRREITRIRNQAVAAPDDPEAIGMLAMFFHTYAMLDAAEICYARAAELAPNKFDWQYYRGKIQTIRGRPEMAVQTFENARAMSNDYPPLLIELGVLYTRQGRLDDAFSVLTTAVQRDPTSYQAHAELGSVLARQGKTEEAIERLTQSTEIAHYAPAHFALGELYRSAGRMEEAEQHYELWKKSPEVFLQDSLITKVESFNYSSKVRLRLARQLFQLGRRDNALKVLRDLMRFYPDNASIHIRLAQYLFPMGRQEEAIQVLREFMHTHPDDADAHAALAQAYGSMGQADKAAFHWRERNRILTADGTAPTSGTDQ